MHPKLMIAAVATAAVLAMNVGARAASEKDVRWDCCYKNGGSWSDRTGSCSGLTAAGAGNVASFQQCVAKGTGKPYQKPIVLDRKTGLPLR